MMDSRLTNPLAERDQFLSNPTSDDSGEQSVFSIGELAREFDITLRTLRFYEDKGLLTPRRSGTMRLYSRRDRARLRLVLMGKRVGFSLSDIRELIDLYDLKDGQVTQLRVAREKFRVQIAKLEQQRKNIEEAITELRRGSGILDEMLAEKERLAS